LAPLILACLRYFPAALLGETLPLWPKRSGHGVLFGSRISSLQAHKLILGNLINCLANMASPSHRYSWLAHHTGLWPASLCRLLGSHCCSRWPLSLLRRCHWLALHILWVPRRAWEGGWRLRGRAADFPRRGEYIRGGHPRDVNPPGGRARSSPVGRQQVAVPRPGLPAPGLQAGKYIYIFREVINFSD